MPASNTNDGLRVAIIGAGPAAFYAADHLLKSNEGVTVDMFDRLPTPYGLVRAGVAPDHQKIKSVTKAFALTGNDARFRFFGNVEFGRDVTLEDIGEHYHQVLFATGAQSDRKMGIPGEDLCGSHPATEFVAWYNGHPDFRDSHFDLSQETVVIVGVGNVAVDVARILCLSRAELEATDMPTYAVEALSNSQVTSVYLVGRRGPAQAAFTTPELKELDEMEEADLMILPAEAELDPLSVEDMAKSTDRLLVRKVEMIQAAAAKPATDKPKKLYLRFFVGPTEINGDQHGQVRSVTLAHNVLQRTETGTLVTKATGTTETIEAGLVFRSVGYRGVPLPGVPFNERQGVILNAAGRVLDPKTEQPLPGVYTSGWIKRGPSGVIGTNKPDSVETANNMLEDAAAERTFTPSKLEMGAIPALLASRGVRSVSFDEWQRLDALELAGGAAKGRPRAKFTSIGEMLAALDGDATPLP